MKKIVFVLLLLLFASVEVDATVIVFKSTGGSGGACDTSLISETGAEIGDYEMGNISSRKYLATKFVATSTDTVCKVDLYLRKLNSPTFDIRVSIFSHDAGDDDPGTLIGTASDVIDSSTLTGSEAVYTFVNISASITDTVTYWIVLEAVTLGDGSNYVRWHYEASGATERVNTDDDASGTWTNISTTVTLKYILYGS